MKRQYDRNLPLSVIVICRYTAIDRGRYMAKVKNYLQDAPKYKGKKKGGIYDQFDSLVLHYPYSVFIEWFNYWKLSGKYVVKVGGKRINFKLDQFKTADDFLLGAGGLLFFADKINPTPVTPATKASKKQNTVTFEVDLNADRNKIVQSFERALSKHKTGPVPTWKTSKAALTPTPSPKHIKLDTLKLMREVYELLQQGLTRREVSEKMGFVGNAVIRRRNKEGLKDEFVASQYEAAYRKVSRHRATVEKILKNVAKGKFP